MRERVPEKQYYLNPAIATFAEGARLRTRRRTVVLQVCANKADSVKSAILKGGKHEKNALNPDFSSVKFFADRGAGHAAGKRRLR